MEALSSLRFPSLPSPTLSSQRPFTIPFSSLPFKSSSRKQPLHFTLLSKEKNHRAPRSSSTQNPSSNSSEKWLLEPVGDGDSRHIGFKVPLPDAFEITSDVVTVGRVPEKADMVIPVATVSGLHARLEKKEGNLRITDLDSTNGTFINEKRLRAGAAVQVPPGSCVTFVIFLCYFSGDTHLAMFRVSKVEAREKKPSAEEEGSGVKTDTDLANDNYSELS
ncbi:uncharacterized protein A4U43_C02F14830 [Asparagus officinalis]|uniref:FHA domain-containing protein n=1 Tax=Asparagus officinalis TaxID=4686 RepID=A0A5P1FL52_ASPOF|nr:uncharacterized protein A4U43_C02F14830 [Asparagus officinalis]